MSGDSSWLATPGWVQDGCQEECGRGTGGVTVQWGWQSSEGRGWHAYACHVTMAAALLC